MTQQPWHPPPPSPPPAPKPKLPLVLGILIGALVPFLGVLIPLMFGELAQGSVMAEILPLVPLGWAFLVLLAGAGLLFSDNTRRWGVGILIGFFGMLIIGAGACVALIVLIIAASSGA